MKFNQYLAGCFLCMPLTLISCQEDNPNAPSFAFSDEFKAYWYSGKAEVGSYNLTQSRYGEDRTGKSMMIFVTENFSKSKQVKPDDQASASADNVSVLKLNMTKNFVTGIYPYSMMLSAFTPVDASDLPHTLKVAMSSQEWCGQVYSQVNLRHTSYEITNHSYFEKEADRGQNLKVALLEDEIWNRIRIDPQSLPVGEMDIIPGFFFLRLYHVEPDIVKATGERKETPGRITYSLTYPEHQRSLTIEFESAFPHRINGWTEKIERDGKTFITTATLDKQVMIDYWTKNKNEFLYLRDSLGLSPQNY